MGAAGVGRSATLDQESLQVSVSPGAVVKRCFGSEGHAGA